MSHESWNDENDFLSGALRGAADEMPGAEVDDLHVSFGVVRDRVRRRRAAKIGGLAGVSLVLVGGIAFGATQTTLLGQGEPVPPGTSQNAFTTPDVSPSASSTQAPDPAPSGPPAASVIQDGYAPSWIRDLGAGLECGMPAADLETTATGWSVAAAGDIYARTTDMGGEVVPTWHMAATTEGGSLDVPPVLVWSQDGVVVDVGPNVFDGSITSEPLLGAGNGAVQAEGSAYTTCAPTDGDAGQVFETPLPEGDYEVRVVAFPQLASGQWATAVSDPVSVRLDADGAHTAAGTRGGAATIEPPEPAEGELSRFVLDRSTDWVTAELTQRDYASTNPVSVTAQCESTDPADVVRYEVVQPSTNAVLEGGQVTCDGTNFMTPQLSGGGEEALDIRVLAVPDGVARFWAVLGPGGDAGAAECSASNLGMEYDPANAPTEAAGATAQAIVEAASACDSERMIQLATEHTTELMYGNETAEQVFGLPENDTLPYETLVRLLAGTEGVVNGGDPGNETITWPRVATEEFADSDEAWAEVVDAGLLTQADADAQRADETFGYVGMVIGIDRSGTWRYYSADE